MLKSHIPGCEKRSHDEVWGPTSVPSGEGLSRAHAKFCTLIRNGDGPYDQNFFREFGSFGTDRHATPVNFLALGMRVELRHALTNPRLSFVEAASAISRRPEGRRNMGPVSHSRTHDILRIAFPGVVLPPAMESHAKGNFVAFVLYSL
jgi:hypothetical protein